MRGSLLVIPIICLLCLWAACRHSSTPTVAAPSAKEVNAFKARLDSLGHIADAGARAAAIRRLYSEAGTGVKNAACEDVLQATRAILLSNTNADTGLLPFHKSLVADSALSSHNRAIVSIRVAAYYGVAGDADSADRYLQDVYRHKEMLDDTQAAKLYGTAGRIAQLRGQLKEASDNIYRSISIFEKIGDSEMVAGACVNLANVYRDMGNYRKAIEVRKKILDVLKRHENKIAEVTTVAGLASDYADIDKPDSARMYFSRAEDMFDSGVQQLVVQYYMYLSKAGMYVTLGRIDSSIQYFDKAKELLPLFNDETQNLLFTIASCRAYSNIRNVSREARLIQDAIPHLWADGNLQVVRDAYNSLYNIALKQDMKEDALTYYQQYDSVRSLLNDRENREYMAEMETKYETQKKTLQIQVQNKELQRRRNLNIILLLSAGLIALASFFFIERLRLQRSKRETRLQNQFTRNLLRNTEDERRRIAGELHDGISHELLTLKNILVQSAIASEAAISNLQQHSDQEAPELQTLKNGLQQTALASETRVDAIISDIRMLSRNLHPVMLDQIGLEHSVLHLCEQLVENGELFVSANIDYQGQLSRYEELQVYRIIQESLTNTRKYAAAIAAQVIIQPKGNQLAVTIMDNGKGFDVDEKLKSESLFGLNSIIQRSKALNAAININSGAEGTTIDVQIPIPHANNHHS